jgi:hypothetical protein
MGMFTLDSTLIRRAYYKVRGLFRRPPELPPDSEREEVEIGPEGLEISVETALNSRCTSDRDDNPKVFHWGIFDKGRTLSQGQMERIQSFIKVPRFTDGQLKIKPERRRFVFLIDGGATGYRGDWMVVESGMQQQALGLVCAALGVGNVFSVLGAAKASYAAGGQAQIGMMVDAMKPSYGGRYWSEEAPAGPSPWKEGNLPAPSRRGDNALLTVLQGLQAKNGEGRKASREDLGQLLWAARGRTPHFYKSAPWGLTIPTNRGEQTNTTVSVIADGRVSKYVNWQDGRPTHSLEGSGSADAGVMKALAYRFGSGRSYVVLSRNATSAVALWEIGYQLLNLMAQASALGLIYEAVLLEDAKLLSGTSIKDPVALFIL